MLGQRSVVKDASEEMGQEGLPQLLHSLAQ
jgi:hypothetical protein